MDAKLAVFEGKKIRRHWDEKQEIWYFSVVDIVQVLTNQHSYQTARKYWNKLAERLRKEGSEFAILTNLIHEEWAGLSVKEHKKLKKLRTQNLRDHMSEAELIFTALMEENKVAGKRGGGISRRARLELETKTGRKVISRGNYLPENRKRLST